jgi:transposase InsO family protein
VGRRAPPRPEATRASTAAQSISSGGVIVDDASGLCQLTWHDRCRADDMVVALQQWFAIFGIVPNWMSDQGPHYKNQVTEKLRRIYGAAHHFSPAHCPWSNGTVEFIMRSIRKTIQAMRVELRVDEDAVDCLLPVVQHALNHTPSPKCNGRAPITAHTQLPAGNALSAYRTKEGVKEIDPHVLAQWRESHWKELAAARDALHRDVNTAANTKRAKERERHFFATTS